MIEHISVVIIVKNGAATLAETLNSVRCFKEVILYDNGSTDETSNIAKQYSNVVVHQGIFKGFGKTKQAAVTLASNDWILSLDADESISQALAQFLSTCHASLDINTLGLVTRNNYFMGELIKNGGWGSDNLARLFNRRAHNINDNNVHESVNTNANSLILKLPGAIEHNAVQNISQFLDKVNLYTEIRRTDAHQNVSTTTYHPLFILIKAMWRFFESYILKAGFLSGWRGLVIAWSKSNEVFFKYIKIYADMTKK